MKTNYYQKQRSTSQQQFIQEQYNKATLEDQEKIMEVANELQMAIISKMPQREGSMGYRHPFSPDMSLELLGAIVLLFAKKNYYKEKE